MKQGIFMRKMEANSTDAIIDIVGVVGWDVAYGELIEMLRAIPAEAKRIVFEIYSPGGSVWEGNAIVQMIGESKLETVARVKTAASMAALVAAACKTREISGNGRILIHNPWAVLEGDAEAMEKRAKELRDIEADTVAFFSARTGQTAEKITALMAEERWLTPAEAVELGFVQTINDPFNAAEYADVRAEIVKAGKWPTALAEIPEAAEEFDCECIDCGAALKSEKHCKDLKCEKCGGQMRRKERPGPGQGTQEGKTDADVNTTRTEGAVNKSADKSGKSADAGEAGKTDDYKLGFAEGETAAKAEYASQLGAVAEKATGLKAKHDALEVLQRKTQGERDSARAQVEKLDAAVQESTAKLEQLLVGGMSFTPSIDTWEEALKECAGNYETARKQYPDQFKADRERVKANRK